MADIKAAYKTFALKLHPDVTGNNEVRGDVGVYIVDDCDDLHTRLYAPNTNLATLFSLPPYPFYI